MFRDYFEFSKMLVLNEKKYLLFNREKMAKIEIKFRVYYHKQTK